MTKARTTPYANCLFEQPWWLDIVAPGQWDEILIEEKGRVVARMPYVKRNSVICMPPYTQTLGIWMAPEVKASYARQKRVINEILDALNGYKRVSVQLPPQNEYVLPFRWRGYNVAPRFTYRLEDLSDLDAVYQNFSQTTRENIRGAAKKVKINNDTDTDNLWRLINSTFSRQNMKPPLPKRIIDHIVTSCEALNHGKYFEAADEEGNIHSCVFIVYDEEACHLLISGQDMKYNRNSRAKSLIVWEGIKLAASHSRVFDFEGSMIEGVENFDQQFGGRCTPYYVVSNQTPLRMIGHIILEHSPLLRKTVDTARKAAKFIRHGGRQ